MTLVVGLEVEHIADTVVTAVEGELGSSMRPHH